MNIIDRMMRAIERVVCVRKVWRCNAGWGMCFILTVAQARENEITTQLHDIFQHELAMKRRAELTAKFLKLKKPTYEQVMAHVGAFPTTDDYEKDGTVFAYYDSLFECVLAEYLVWVRGAERMARGGVVKQARKLKVAS